MAKFIDRIFLFMFLTWVVCLYYIGRFVEGGGRFNTTYEGNSAYREHRRDIIPQVRILHKQHNP